MMVLDADFESFNLDLCHRNRQLYGRQEEELTMIYVGGLGWKGKGGRVGIFAIAG